MERTSGAGPTALVDEAPVNVAPLPRVTVAVTERLWVPAATEASQGLMCATVLADGPLFPADVETKTPASAAKRYATSTALR